MESGGAVVCIHDMLHLGISGSYVYMVITLD